MESGLKRDSLATSRGLSVEPLQRKSGGLPVAAGSGVAGLREEEPPRRRQDFIRYRVQEELSPNPFLGGGPTPAAVTAAVAAAQGQHKPATGAQPSPLGAASAGPQIAGVPVAGRMTLPEPGPETHGVAESMADRYSAAEQAKEMLQGSLDMPSKAQVDATRMRADNTGGYAAGTAAGGGGSGGTTEAMTGGLAAGGALEDDSRRGMGDISRGQM